ncbi:MAG: ferritin-like domain-containing protein [Deltaproteobacteria bacterium]
MGEGACGELAALCALEIDAANSYETGVRNIEVYEIRERAGVFLSDHYRSINELSQLIERLGGAPPVDMPSAGPITGALRNVAPEERTESVLSDLLLNEQILVRAYGCAQELRPGDEAERLIAGIRGEEEGHIAYLQNALDRRLWENLPEYHRTNR